MGGALCTLEKREPERSATGAEIVDEIIDDRELVDNVFTEDSDADSEFTNSVYSGDEIESITERHAQTVLGMYETTEKRVNGIIQVHAESAPADRVQDFWTMIVKKRIPTIFMMGGQWSALAEGQNNAQYVPRPSESTFECGEYIVERIGHVSALSGTLYRQFLVIYRPDGSAFKHHVVHFYSSTPDDYEAVTHQASRMANPQVLMHGGAME